MYGCQVIIPHYMKIPRKLMTYNIGDKSQNLIKSTLQCRVKSPPLTNAVNWVDFGAHATHPSRRLLGVVSEVGECASVKFSLCLEFECKASHLTPYLN